MAMAIPSTQSLDFELRALADPMRLGVLCLMHEKADGMMEIEQIVSSLSTSRSADSVYMALHHAHLPKLQEAGFIEYDEREGVIQYRDDELFTKLVNTGIIDCREYIGVPRISV